MTTFVLTAEQIKDIYRAGMRHGEEEATSSQCGSRVTGHEYDELIDAIHTIVNEGVRFEEQSYIRYNTVEDWFKKKK